MPATTRDDGTVLLTEAAGGVMTLTLNRPEARNALSPELVTALDAALTRFEKDDGIRAAVITGRGPAFCAGLDLKVFAAAGADRRSVGDLLRRFGRLAKPVVGAVNGPAVAGGLELALGCDFLIGGPRAMFADTHVRIGAFPGGGMTARLERAVGVRTAKAMSLAGLRLDAGAALRAGLLAEVVENDALLARAHELAGAIAAAKPELVAVVNRLYDENGDLSLDDALAAEEDELERWRSTQPSKWSV
ncbi:enoyl-CoA hydratase [Actinomadura sp. LD22]|uniref:Enoyl-CoA hydratase n=1 Tax=Actinomadura physcomitrii TaxID=2650748 RepID=A0A6I4M4F0_9ACTN|nr:enoyl-CoA hydratase [Actinomadura physcomitrii]MWA00948.1 enoyl-CoA hydratase [Actinomadura physcomitrii]